MSTIEQAMTLENNSYVEGTFAVSDLSLRPFKEKEGRFLIFVLQDKTGRINGKIWDNADSAKALLQEESVISVEGKVNLFGGKNQIIVEKFQVVTDYSLGDFIITSPKDPNVMFSQLFNTLNSHIEDTAVKELLEKGYLQDKAFVERFKTCPGGKGDVHHAYIYGLLEHTLSVVETCLYFAEHYKTLHVNKSTLLMGAFLHDLGKMEAYDYRVSINMTDVGRLHGHIPLGYHSFMNIANSVLGNTERSDELKKVLGHMILSHHGTYEHEAARLPMTQEAILLAHADDIDSESCHVARVLENAVDGWTQFDHMRNKMYYLRETKFEEEIQKTVEEKEKPLIRRKLKKADLINYPD